MTFLLDHAGDLSPLSTIELVQKMQILEESRLEDCGLFFEKPEERSRFYLELIRRLKVDRHENLADEIFYQSCRFGVWEIFSDQSREQQAKIESCFLRVAAFFHLPVPEKRAVFQKGAEGPDRIEALAEVFLDKFDSPKAARKRMYVRP
ncbi:MAG: hypothetical protein WC371_03985 [Parachlamydiales bacterium]|jgi:hypothetical protein